MIVFAMTMNNALYPLGWNNHMNLPYMRGELTKKKIVNRGKLSYNIGMLTLKYPLFY